MEQTPSSRRLATVRRTVGLYRTEQEVQVPSYRVRLNFPELSYGLALLRLFRTRAVRQKGLGTLWSKRRRAGVWRQSTGLTGLYRRGLSFHPHP